MYLTEAAEEMLESLWVVKEGTNSDQTRLSDLREAHDVDVVKELIDAGIIEKIDGEQIKITEKGLVQARDAIRRHRLAERLLTDVIAVKKELIHDAACQFEHHLHKGIDANVCTLLGHPKYCPHGKPIPAGRCCEKREKVVAQAVKKLSDMKLGERGKVAYLHTTDPKRIQKMISMGVAPGMSIELLAAYPSYLFQLNEAQFAVDKEFATEICVRRED